MTMWLRDRIRMAPEVRPRDGKALWLPNHSFLLTLSMPPLARTLQEIHPFRDNGFLPVIQPTQDNGRISAPHCGAQKPLRLRTLWCTPRKDPAKAHIRPRDNLGRSHLSIRPVVRAHHSQTVCNRKSLSVDRSRGPRGLLLQKTPGKVRMPPIRFRITIATPMNFRTP